MRRTSLPTRTGGEERLLSRCPFLRQTAADWLWPVEGFCRARPDGRLMIPSVPYYLHLCTTGEHHLCEAFRARTHGGSSHPID